jgi:hypothetical protein
VWAQRVLLSVLALALLFLLFTPAVGLLDVLDAETWVSNRVGGG